MKRNKLPQPTKFDKNNLKLVYKIAWSFHKTTGFDVQELIAQGSLAYLEAMKTFDTHYGVKLSWWCWRWVENDLRNFIAREKRHYIVSDYNQWENEPSEDVLEIMLDSLQESSQYWYKDCQFVLDMIMAAPEMYNSIRPKFARGLLYRQLREQDWKWERIWTVIREMKKVLNESEAFCILN